MPETLLIQFAETTEHADQVGGDIMSSLGVDWQMLAFQMISFALVVFLFGKYIFPTFMRIIDERQTKIDESLDAAREAETHAATAQDRIDKQLAKARLEARDIVTTAKDEASAMMAKADEKAKQNAQHVLEQAHDEISKEVIAAKKALHNETLELVAAATARVVGQTHSKDIDRAVISEALKEADK